MRGNCDFFAYDEPITQTIFLDNYKVLITHGDYYKVKNGFEGLQAFAEGNGYNLVCFGHTHQKVLKKENNVTYVNAGSLKNGDYAEITLTKDKILVEFRRMGD